MKTLKIIILLSLIFGNCQSLKPKHVITFNENDWVYCDEENGVKENCIRYENY